MTVAESLKAELVAALDAVQSVATGRGVISGGQVRELVVSEDGAARFQFVLAPGDPGTLVREARAAAEAVPGITRVKIDVSLPKAPGTEKPASRGLQPGSVPAPTPKPGVLAGVRYVIAVSSGKGGVGKSTVATNLACSLAAAGLSVGLLDADIYGPNIPTMFGETRRPRVSGDKGSEMIEPLLSHGVKLMSLGFLLEPDQPAIMRGPLIAGILRQFVEQVEWGALDAMVIDLPPGTGDAQLSLIQTVNVAGVVMVTTPQDVSTGDVLRAIRMFEKVKTPIIGLVENMSGLWIEELGRSVEVFGREGGGQRLAEKTGIPFLGMIPLDPAVGRDGDAGTPTVLAGGKGRAAEAFRGIAETVLLSIGAVKV